MSALAAAEFDGPVRVGEDLMSVEVAARPLLPW
jgi:hypothetical protein